MELVYLWVEDYKNIYKQGFNFSARFNCKYDPDSNELTIDENEDYIPDFFGENINVTAIVGKNGSGKSSLLDVIIYPNTGNQFILLIDNIYFYLIGANINGKNKILILDFLNRKINIEISNQEYNIENLNILLYENILSVSDSDRYNANSYTTNKHLGLSRKIFNAVRKKTLPGFTS